MRQIPSRRLRIVVASTAVLAMLAVGGCTSTEATLSADEFRAQATAICTEYGAKTNDVAMPAGPDQFSDYLGVMLPIAREQVDRLKTLAPPADLRDDFRASLDLRERSLARISKVKADIDGGADPLVAINAGQAEIQDLNQQADSKARAIGLRSCADTGGTGEPVSPASPTE